MKKNDKGNSCSSAFLPSQPWSKNDNSIWMASTLSLSRNVEKFKFPAKLDAVRQKQILGVLSKELLASPLLNKPTLIHAEESNPQQKEFFVEHFLSAHGFQQARQGEAFIFDRSGEFLATLNMRDHIHLHLLDCKGELEESLNRLIQIETTLGKSVKYAFSPKYGFLTSDFNQCGTALNVSVFLQLPALIHTGQIDPVLEKLIDDTLYVTGIQGNPTEVIGDLIVIQNNYALGISEENIIASIRTCTTKFLVEEHAARSRILKEESAEIKDCISRAFGILIHSYQIEAIESINAISLVKLGAELGWVKGISLAELNQLFLNCRRAHLLQCNEGETYKQEEIPHKRAEFIHKALKNVTLTI